MCKLKGVYLINERQHQGTERIFHCKSAVNSFMKANQIQAVKLNSNQLNDYYTIPHALLYDLNQAKVQLDYLVVYSNQDVNEFIYMYPAKWVLLKSYFSGVVFVEE
ncbi:hypothetical protein RRV45_17375 [Bacillus sp. DTU_2020_1000418_1_SI_GHA_SEK_038]|uniref:hypothetical protein n=1 Tax=Bacillus sp. DTU_2020_1000418_1_SI_GHA_SEK_038 TaxID=3077585 RepID=UPI0028E2AF60|nr:hypothetical protein [Bacillus sp. DTU_2020_1000418_1_SI_GHA_SEK_038]WNS74664.1 hypothetical protein RRV45_17375 [Bacillus sp. DTU_2020_1000418_1_SI_GHA_SEK_038]